MLLRKMRNVCAEKSKRKGKVVSFDFFLFFFSLPLPPTNQVDFFYVIFVSFHLQCIYSIVVEADLNVRITRIKWNIRKHKFDLSCVGETKKKTHKNFSSYPKNMKTPLNTSEEEKPFFMWAFFSWKRRMWKAAEYNKNYGICNEGKI